MTERRPSLAARRLTARSKISPSSRWGGREGHRIALITATATLTGVLLTVTATAIVSDRQIDAQKEQARSDYFRDQRRSLYARVIQQDAVITTEQRALKVEAQAVSGETLPEFLKRAQRMDRAIDELGRLNSEVLLIGSKLMTGKSQRLYLMQFLAAGALMEIAQPPPHLKPESAVRSWDRLRDLASGAMVDFLEQARSDLNTEN